MPQIQIIFIPLLLLHLAHCFWAPITIDATATTTITNYRADLASCQCDLSGNCDNFCCCDTACSQTQTTTWTTNGWCRESAAEIEKFCSQLSGSGYSSFEDLGCVYYSNRGQIGMYYDLPTSELTTPADEKFANRIGNSQQISAVQSTSYQYGSVLSIQKDGTTSTFNIWRPVISTGCGVGFAKVSDSQQFSCMFEFQTTADCVRANSYLTSTTLSICEHANCSTTKLNLGSNVPDGSNCNNVITGIDLALTYTYSTNQYIISSATLTTTTSTITIPSNQQITTKITVTTGTKLSGNPGYIIGEQVLFKSGSIPEISDPSRNCYATGSVNNFLSLPFGINTSYSCITTATRCSSSLEVDTIAGGNFQFERYANSSDTTGVQVSGLSSTCLKEQIILNILYSKAGSSFNEQNYILAARMTAVSGQTDWTTKYLLINWIEVDPSTVITPPSNLFYEYFSYLWSPLTSTFRTVLRGQMLSLMVGLVMMIVLI